MQHPINPYMKAIEFLEQMMQQNNNVFKKFDKLQEVDIIVRDEFNAGCLRGIDALHNAYKESLVEKQALSG